MLEGLWISQVSQNHQIEKSRNAFPIAMIHDQQPKSTAEFGLRTSILCQPAPTNRLRTEHQITWTTRVPDLKQ